MIVGLDTGFFVQLARGEPEAGEIWGPITRSEISAVISCLTIFELQRLGLRGTVEKEMAETFLEEIPVLSRVIWLDHADLIRRAARIAHGNNLSMADALILVSLQQAGADVIYTTDADLEAYSAGPQIRLI